MQRRFLDYAIITLKGLAMGAADVVPGVSGGTIAFISGIYQELIDSINKVNFGVLKTFRTLGLKAAWKQINGGFLFSLVLGIGISILTFAKIITFSLAHYPILVWAFFFGLVIASIAFVMKDVDKWTLRSIIFLIFGTIVSYLVTIIEPTSSPDSYLYLFFSGFVAIIAMVLPGISGAFILLLMGSYTSIIKTINQFRDALFNLNWDLLQQTVLKLLTFAIGAIIGLKLFSKILHWMFQSHKNPTLALLIGFMIGSLNKIWPWKKTLTWRKDSAGIDIPLVEKSISPFSFDGNPQIVFAICLMLMGFLTIFILEKLGAKKD